jgi:ABC-2 type transport system permease protein
MNRNLILMELKRNALSLLLWVVVIVLLISFTMSVFNTFVENQSKIMGMMSIIPEGMLEFKGVTNINDMVSVLGFYSINNVIYMMVLGSIFSIVLSSSILLKEEYQKTAEYLLTKPLTRFEVFNSKLVVIFLNVLLLNLVAVLTGFISMELVKKDPFSIRAFLVLSTYTFLLNFLFGSLGLFLSTLVKRAKPITTFCIGLVLLLYFIFTISKITQGIQTIGYLTPFKYVNTDALNPNYSLNPWHLLYFGGISLLLIWLSYRIYKRKDIYT